MNTTLPQDEHYVTARWVLRHRKMSVTLPQDEYYVAVDSAVHNVAGE